MPEDEKPITPVEAAPEGSGDSIDSLGGSLSELFEEIPSHEDLPPKPEPKAESTATALTADDVKKLIAESRTELEDKVGELEQTNTYLRGRLEERSDASPPPVAVAEPEFTYDKAELAAKLEQNAPEALTEYIDKYIAHREAKLRKELGKEVDSKVGATEKTRAFASARDNDIRQMASEFSEQLRDKDFIKQCDTEIAGIIRARGGASWQDYLPGDYQAAASRVALRLAREGKINLNGKKAESNGDLSLREVVRRVPASDSVGTRNGGVRTSSAATVADLFPGDERSQRIARKVAQQQGISEAQYVRSYQRAKLSDPDFDRR